MLRFLNLNKLNHNYLKCVHPNKNNKVIFAALLSIVRYRFTLQSNANYIIIITFNNIKNIYVRIEYIMSNLSFSYEVTKNVAYYTISFTITNSGSESYSNWLLYFEIPRNQVLYNYSSCYIFNAANAGQNITVIGDNNTSTIPANSSVQFTINIAADYGYVPTGPYYIALNSPPSIIPELATVYPASLAPNGNFEVEWNATPGTESYVLQVCNDGLFVDNVYTFRTKDTYYNFDFLSPQTYVFRVASSNSYGQTGWSGPLNVFVPSPEVDVPTLALAGPPVNNQITLNYSSSLNSFILVQANDILYTQNVVTLAGPGPSVTLTLQSGTYYFKLAAYDTSSKLYSYYSFPVAVAIS